MIKRVSVTVSSEDLDWAKAHYISISKVLQDALKKLHEEYNHGTQRPQESDCRTS